MDKLKDIPERKQFQKSFLCITGLQHYENAWSNIYAYYCNPQENHGLGDVFVRALEQLIAKRTGCQIRLQDWWIQLELATDINEKDDNKKRIDLVNQDWNNAIIIENKVYHTLNNDLDLYWDSVKYSNHRKTGLVLTLSPIHIIHRNWVNITHKEWIDCVKSMIRERKIQLNERNLIYLNDFMSTIETLSDNKKEELAFYLRNRELLNHLNSIINDSKKSIQDLFCDPKFAKRIGLELIHKERTGAKYRYVMYKFPGTDSFVVTIVYEFLWKSIETPPFVFLCLEPLDTWWNLIKNSSELRKDIKGIADIHGVGCDNKPSKFWHCARLRVPLKNSELLDKCCVQNIIAEHLQCNEPLIKAAEEIIQLIRSKS